MSDPAELSPASSSGFHISRDLAEATVASGNPHSVGAFVPRRADFRSRRGAAGALFAAGVLSTAALDLLAASRSRQAERSPVAAQGCTVLWSPPETVKSRAGRPVMVDAPRVVRLRSGLVVVGRIALETNDSGWVVPVPRAPQNYQRAGVVIRDDGLADFIPVPLDTGISFPRIAALTDSTALVVWAHQDDDESLVSTIWSAELAGVTWRNVQRLHRGAQLTWGPTIQSDLVASGGEASFAAGLVELRDEAGVVLFRRLAGTWRANSLPIASPRYIQLADLPGDTLLVVAVLVADPHGNTVFAQRYDLAGRPVSDLMRVSPASYGPVYDPQVVAATDSSLYVVWLSWRSTQAPPPGDSGNQRLHLARSTDRGVSWEHVEGPRVDMRLGSWVTAMVDSSGALHVSLLVHHGSTRHPGHVIWDGRAWHATEPPRVHDGELMNAPLVVERGRDSLLMLWGSLQSSNRRGFPGVLLSSVGSRTCEPRAPR